MDVSAEGERFVLLLVFNFIAELRRATAVVTNWQSAKRDATSPRIIQSILSLTPGTRLGPYDIVGALGAGGMGEVYRATDTHLRRQVAITVLPASVAADADRLARFQREAEVLAALNHPNMRRSA